MFQFGRSFNQDLSASPRLKRGLRGKLGLRRAYQPLDLQRTKPRHGAPPPLGEPKRPGLHRIQAIGSARQRHALQLALLQPQALQALARRENVVVTRQPSCGRGEGEGETGLVELRVETRGLHNIQTKGVAWVSDIVCEPRSAACLRCSATRAA